MPTNSKIDPSNDGDPLLQSHSNYYNMSTSTFSSNFANDHANAINNTNTNTEEEQKTSETAATTTQNKTKSIPYTKIILGLALLVIITLIIIDSLTTKHIQSAFQSFLEWTSTHLLIGFFAFIGVYALATVLFIPGSILTIGSGFIFGNAVDGSLGVGMVIASAAVFVGASLGAVGSFLLGRYLVRDWVERVLVGKYPLVRALDGALQQKGFRIFLLLRLSPIIPFNAINYIAGVTAVSLKYYVLALVGILPGTVVYCFIGASASSLAEGQSVASGNRTLTIVSVVLGIVLGLIAVFAVSYYAKKEFNKIVAEEQRRLDEAGQQQTAEDYVVNDRVGDEEMQADESHQERTNEILN